MNRKEAIEWLTGSRSMTNSVPCQPLETWNIRICEADAAMMKQAYYYLKAYDEKLIKERT